MFRASEAEQRENLSAQSRLFFQESLRGSEFGRHCRSLRVRRPVRAVPGVPFIVRIHINVSMPIKILTVGRPLCANDYINMIHSDAHCQRFSPGWNTSAIVPPFLVVSIAPRSIVQRGSRSDWLPGSISAGLASPWIRTTPVILILAKTEGSARPMVWLNW